LKRKDRRPEGGGKNSKRSKDSSATKNKGQLAKKTEVGNFPAETKEGTTAPEILNGSKGNLGTKKRPRACGKGGHPRKKKKKKTKEKNSRERFHARELKKLRKQNGKKTPIKGVEKIFWFGQKNVLGKEKTLQEQVH